jgi:hypothetical protein
MTGRKILYIFWAFFLCPGVFTVSAQDVRLTSSVDDTSISMNDQIVLTITVSGPYANKAGLPQISDMPEFTLSRPSQESESSFGTGGTFHIRRYKYTLYPEKPGIFDVGAVSVKVGREVITAPATKVKVVSGPKAQTPADSDDSSSRSAGDISLFITTDVDKEEVYVGEQVTYTFELYRAVSASSPVYDPPVTTGFWAIDLPDIPVSKKQAGNNIYTNNTIKKALFPTTSGELTIGPTTFTYAAQRGFFTTGPTKRLRTQPIAITVKPLPASGKPDNFEGAVGDFEISSTISSTNVLAGDVVTLRISITGSGNLDLVSSIGEPDLSAFKTYDPKISESISNSGFVVGGLKTWEYVIIPKEQGTATVGPFSLSYFNPADKSYHTVSTQPYILNVEPSAAVSVTEAREGAGDGSFRNLASDIRYIKPEKTALGNVTKRVYTSVLFYLLYVLPLGAFVAAVIVKRRQDTIERNTGLKRKLNAFKKAQKRLREASEMLKTNDIKMLCGKLHETILFYIGDMLNVDTGSLTSDDLESVLKRGSIDPEFAEHIRKTLEMCDFVRFASVGDESEFRETIVKDTHDIIVKLKEALKYT